MKPAESSFERRAFGRRPTTIKASVRLGYRIVACTIKDISEGGALLAFDEDIELPARLWLSWTDSAEIMCDVRHVRNRNAGVQFVRPQALALRPAIAPSHNAAADPAPRSHESAPATRASDIVARCRRALREPQSALTPSAAPVLVRAATAEAETRDLQSTPRDVSTILASLRAAAEALAAQKAARRVPTPLPAANWTGAAIQPPPLALQRSVPLPLAARDYAEMATQIAAQQAEPVEGEDWLQTPYPWPLAASRCAGAVVAPPSLALLPVVPWPLPAGDYAAATACKAHPCALAVWRNMTIAPPRPLPARGYAIRVA